MTTEGRRTLVLPGITLSQALEIGIEVLTFSGRFFS
jgi:hypothetical protein